MPFSYTNSKGQSYYLHGKKVTLQGGRQQQIHYFRREPRAGEVMDAVPEGYEVTENERTGLPFLRRKGAGKSASKK
jgi:hypothetical protein